MDQEATGIVLTLYSVISTKGHVIANLDLPQVTYVLSSDYDS